MIDFWQIFDFPTEELYKKKWHTSEEIPYQSQEKIYQLFFWVVTF